MLGRQHCRMLPSIMALSMVLDARRLRSVSAEIAHKMATNLHSVPHSALIVSCTEEVTSHPGDNDRSRAQWSPEHRRAATA